MTTALEYWVFLPADAADHGPTGGPRPCGGIGGLRRHRDHGPPGPAPGRGLADVRSNADECVARRPDRAAPCRITGPLRLVPASRACWRVRPSPSTMPPEGASSSVSAGARSSTRCAPSGSGRSSPRNGSAVSGNRSRSSRRCGPARHSTTRVSIFTLHGAQQQPGPIGKIPIVIGGAGKGTMRLVAAHADWWNVHTGIVDKLDEMRPFVRERPVLTPGAGGVRPTRRARARRSKRRPAAASGRARSSAPVQSSWTTSGHSADAGSSASTCGSATSHRPTHWRALAMASSASSGRAATRPLRLSPAPH